MKPTYNYNSKGTIITNNPTENPTDVKNEEFGLEMMSYAASPNDDDDGDGDTIVLCVTFCCCNGGGTASLIEEDIIL